MTITEKLLLLADAGLREFNASLIPNTDKARIIGVRTPALRAYAKELIKSGEGAEFIKTLPHAYHEEDMLHAFIVAGIRDFDTAMYETERFLPHIDNWAVCDSFSPRIFGENLSALLLKIREWINAEHEYTVRFGICMLMRYFLDDGAFKCEYLSLAAGIKREEYYIKMMLAWFFATSLAKQYGATLPYITERRLSPWVHNKTIQKAVESYRISEEQKAFLRGERIKDLPRRR